MPPCPNLLLTIIQPIQHGFYLVDAVDEDLLSGKVRVCKGHELSAHTLDPLPAFFTLDGDQFNSLLLAHLQGEKQTGVEDDAHMARTFYRRSDPIEEDALALFGKAELLTGRGFLRRNRAGREQALFLQPDQKGIEFAGFYAPDVGQPLGFFDFFVEFVAMLGMVIEKP
jgi:hypothetical protein